MLLCSALTGSVGATWRALLEPCGVVWGLLHAGVDTAQGDLSCRGGGVVLVCRPHGVRVRQAVGVLHGRCEGPEVGRRSQTLVPTPYV